MGAIIAPASPIPKAIALVAGQMESHHVRKHLGGALIPFLLDCDTVQAADRLLRRNSPASPRLATEMRYRDNFEPNAVGIQKVECGTSEALYRLGFVVC